MRLLDPHQNWPPHRLLVMLKDAQAREEESWKNYLLSPSVDKKTEVGPAERDYVVAWLAHLNEHLGFDPETFFLAAQTLDRFITAVKCQPKYIKCVTVTCLYIASKVLQEEEDIPGTAELVENTDCGCRVQDIHRMERIILSKLEWKIMSPTTLTYLQIFHTLVFSNHLKPQFSLSGDEHEQHDHSSPLSRHLDLLTNQLQNVICRYKLASCPSAAMALALLSIEIENTSDASHWVATTSKLQSYAKIKTNDLMSCREVLMSLLPRRLCNPYLNNPVYVICDPTSKAKITEQKQAAMCQAGANKRKANDVNYVVLPMVQVKKLHTFHKCKGSTRPTMDLHHPHREIQNLPPDLALGDPHSQGMYGAGESLGGCRQRDDQDPNTVTNHWDMELSPSKQTHSCTHQAPNNQTFNGNLTTDSGIDAYDSDKTLTASEGEEEEDEIERNKHHDIRMRPVTYAEIVKRGILESTANAVATVTRACV